jgi:hypothetical protein
MENQKKPLKSKPAAKKKATATPHLDSRIIDGLVARVSELASELKGANQKLDYVVVTFGFNRNDEASEAHEYTVNFITEEENGVHLTGQRIVHRIVRRNKNRSGIRQDASLGNR